jgi:hypothetical protein
VRRERRDYRQTRGSRLTGEPPRTKSAVGYECRRGSSPERDVSIVDLSQDFSISEAVHAYEDLPDVEYAEPNFLLKPASVPNDPFFDKM